MRLSYDQKVMCPSRASLLRCRPFKTPDTQRFLCFREQVRTLSLKVTPSRVTYDLRSLPPPAHTVRVELAAQKTKKYHKIVSVFDEWR